MLHTITAEMKAQILLWILLDYLPSVSQVQFILIYAIDFFFIWRILIYVIFVIATLVPQTCPRATQRESRSIEIDKLIHNNDGRPLDMIFDKEGGTWRAVGG